MALRFPSLLPEAYRHRVIASEAVARVALATDFAAAQANVIVGSRLLTHAAFEAGVTKYLNASCSTFVDQAFLAIQHRAMPLGDLEEAFETFLKLLQHHVYFGVHYAQIRLAPGFGEFESFNGRTGRNVRGSDWHTAYLLAIPGLLAELERAADLSTGTDPAGDARSRRRRDFVNPRLGALGLTVTKWAELAGVDRSVAFDYLSGKSAPRQSTIDCLATVLNVKSEELPR